MKKQDIIIVVCLTFSLVGYLSIGARTEKKLPVAQEEKCTASPAVTTIGEIKRESEVESFEQDEIKVNGLTERQKEVLEIAREIGSEYDLEEIMMGIVMQESIAGVLSRVGHMSAEFGKRSYGVAQVKVTAARDVLRHHNELGEFRTDEELIGKLIYDDEFNIRISALYFLHLRNSYDLSWKEALTAYNLGPTGMKRVKNPTHYKYTKAVINHIRSRKIQQFFTQRS